MPQASKPKSILPYAAKAKPVLLNAGYHVSQPDSAGYTLLLIGHGSGKIRIFQEIFSVTTGSVCLLDDAVPYQILFDQPDHQLCCFRFSDHAGKLPALFLQERFFCADGTQCGVSDTLTLGKMIVGELERKDAMYNDLARNMMKVLLMMAARIIDTMRDPEQIIFLRVKDFIDLHFVEIDSIQSVCKKLDVNQFHLIHIFGERLGMPPGRYINYKRMEQAKGMLVNSTLSVNEIAVACGYSDTAYFCRVFKKIVGKAPLVYKKITLKSMR